MVNVLKSTTIRAVQEETEIPRLFMGNKAFSQGCLEAGVRFAAAYPGSPSSEIIDHLASVAKNHGMYVEWSTNEKVALEAAAAASYSGLRAVCAMKQNGLNVASDFIMTANKCETDGGLVVIICDDPSAISSNNEQDPRPFAKWSNLPLLEPASFQEAKDMTRWAFDLSEELKCLVLVRGQTRLSHSRGNVKLGQLPNARGVANFNPTEFPISGLSDTTCPQHKRLLDKLERASEIFESSLFNTYEGLTSPELLIITSGVCYLYCAEAVKKLKLESSVGILKLATIWPLPRKLVEKHLSSTKRVLFVEQVDPFIENSVRDLSADLFQKTGFIKFYGKSSGHISSVGELNPSIVMQTLSKLMNVSYVPRNEAYDNKAKEIMDMNMLDRGITFCPGCPHRATYWTINNTLKLIGGNGFTAGDIGCYTMGIKSAGYCQLKTLHAMGSGAGLATGFGQLGRMGFTQPVLAVCGDSTFYHAVIPALINGVYNKSNFTLLVLDNSGTAMTGFQPHPGTGKSAMGDDTPIISIEKLCDSLGVKVDVVDPFDLKTAERKLIQVIKEGYGVRIVILRRSCELIRKRGGKSLYSRIYVDSRKCLGDSCGCNRLCSRVFNCPGIIWNKQQNKAQIDEAVCAKCGVCTEICPASAIVKEVA